MLSILVGVLVDFLNIISITVFIFAAVAGLFLLLITLYTYLGRDSNSSKYEPYLITKGQ